MEKKNRKRYSLLLVMLMLTCLIWNSTLSVKAEGEKKIGESYLTHEEEAEGTTPVKVMRGEDLMTGYSKIRRMGPEKLYAGVRCVHSANEDISSSFTNGVFIEKKSILEL